MSLVCGLLTWWGTAHAEEAERTKTEAPANDTPDSAQERSRAEFAERQAQQAWFAASAEFDKATATAFRFLAGTVEEKAAWERVAKVAAKQAAAAKEMKEAWARLGRAEQLGPKAKAAPKERGGARAAEADAAVKQLSAQAEARGAAWEVWERARGDLAKANVGRFDEYLNEPTPDTGPTSAPVPRPSWWCATNFFDHRRQACWQTEKECEAKRSEITPYMDCREQEIVTILEFTQVNRGPVFLAFPLLSQCESMRKALLKDKTDVRVVGKCHSSAVSAP